MAAKFDELLAEILRLPAPDRERLLELLEASQTTGTFQVREPTASYQASPMRSVTILLPDDIADRAQDAGLLSSKELEGILRRALQAQGAREGTRPSRRQRRLVQKNGYLVAEASPGERRITSEEVRDILDDMES